MRYIRTKDINNLIIDTNDPQLPPHMIVNNYIDFNSCGRYEIVNQADTVEELCDRFLLAGIDIIFLNKEHTQYHFEGDETWYDITDSELRMGIRAAIWTEQGLTYVTKPMNEKGEFELL